MAIWSPQPGPQAEAAICPADFTFFGGSRGGGKSDCLLGRQIRGAERYEEKWNGLIIRRKYKEFAELRRRIDEMIQAGLPAERIGGDQQPNFVRFKNGAQISMPAIARYDMVGDFVGHQYTEVSIDECTTFPFFTKMVDKLKGSTRSPHGVPCRMFGTGNPGGPGHNEVKQYFRLGRGSGVDPKTVIYGDDGDSRVFIPSFLHDNHILCDNDPKYVNRLLSIKDPLLKKAWIDGDWDVFIGQAFAFSETYHVMDAETVPNNAPIYMTFDWGFGKPFSIGWWWVDEYGCLYRFSEWYGSTGIPDEGIRFEDSRIAEGIKEREQKMGIGGRMQVRYCDPTCFNKKPDYRGGGQGPSTAEVFAGFGIYLTPGDPSRELKIRQMRERLRYEVDEHGNLTTKPMMRIYRTCKDFIRTIPALCFDDNNPEDIDCFVGGTLISTPHGAVAIQDLRAGDMVNTPIGPRRVTKAGVAGREQIITVSTSNNVTIEATRDHKIYVKGYGLLPVCLLSSGHELIREDESCLQNAASTEVSNSQSDRGEGILSAILAMLGCLERPCSIGQYGWTLLVQSMRGNTSITRTMTPAITPLRIWNSFLRDSMQDNITKKELLPVTISEKLICAGLKASGENQLFAKTLRRAAIELRNENLRALIVANLLQRDIPDSRIAPSNAKTNTTELGSSALYAGHNFLQKSTTPNRLKPVVTSVVGDSEEKTVYYLTVEQAHLFYANGILTANTEQEDHVYDEAALICMARPMKSEVAPSRRPSMYDKRLEQLERGYSDDSYSIMERQQREAFRELGIDIEGTDINSFIEDRGGTPIPTIMN